MMKKNILILIPPILVLFLNLVSLSHGSSNLERRYALLIGIGDYQDPNIVDRPNCTPDLKRLAQILGTKGLFDMIYLLTDSAPPDDPYYASKKNINSVLIRILEEMEPKDALLLLFIGQGITTELGKGYLLACDSRLSNLNKTAISLDWLTSRIEKSRIMKSIIILDAQEARIIKQGTVKGLYPDRYIDRNLPAIIYGAERGCFNNRISERATDLFIDTLIKGLNGSADTEYAGNSDSIITLAELVSYLKEEMAKKSPQLGSYQIPYASIRYPLMGSLLISTTKESGHRAQVFEPTERPLKTEIVKKAKVKKESPEKIFKKPVPEKKVPEGKIFKKPIPSKKKKVGSSKKKPPVQKKKVESKRPIIKEELQKSKPRTKKEEIKQTKQEKEVKEKPVEVSRIEKLPEEIPSQIIKSTTPAPETPKGKEEEKQRISKEKIQVNMISEEKKEPKILPPPEPILLRNTPQDITPEKVRSLLVKYNFYSTCWTYNSDFCNPEGEFFNRFIDNRNGTITDQATNLMWQKGGSEEPITWYDASEYVKKINEKGFAGYTDWRLPTVEELASLLESSWKNHDLFIDPIFDRKQRHCWSADTYGIKRAWKVNYHMGFIIDFPMSDKNWIRLVRTIKK